MERTSTEPRFSFPASKRLLKSPQFKAVLSGGRKRVTPWFVVYQRRNDLPMPRIGITVSRKVGGAVVRNQVKRLVREAFRLSRQASDLHPHGAMDWVVIARPQAATIAKHQLRGALDGLFTWQSLK